jgi:23S rRNA U2552 (ribose-2'-O)-methylase RlmE/FtsJ
MALGDGADEGALKRDGSLVVKILEGGGSVEELTAASKGRFEKVNWFKPKATRSESKEIYLVCRKRKT